MPAWCCQLLQVHDLNDTESYNDKHLLVAGSPKPTQSTRYLTGLMSSRKDQLCSQGHMRLSPNTRGKSSEKAIQVAWERLALKNSRHSLWRPAVGEPAAGLAAESQQYLPA